MSTQPPIRGRAFFQRAWSVCALCGALAVSAYGQTPPASEGGAGAANGAANGAASEAPEGAGDVAVSNYGTVDLAVQDTDLAQVLQMLSIQSKKNIITSRSVSAT